MNFANDQHFILLWLTPLLVYIFWRAHKSLQKRMQKFAAPSLLTTHLYQRRSNKMLTRYSLLLLAFVCMVLALARPQFDFEWSEVKTKSKDLYIIVDVSQSMLAGDIAPNRLERAKRKLTDLLTMLTGERVSLIAFAGASFTQCPLTRDYSAAQLFLEHLQPDLIPVAGTAIGEALALALDSIEKNASPVGSAIILLTDGEDEGSAPLQQATRAAKAGIKIYPIGIGSVKGVPIPDKQGNYIKDDNGNLILSRIGEQTLQRLALDTGGTYVRSVHGDFDLEQVYTKGIKSMRADTTLTGNKKKVWREHYYLPLLLALLALLGEFALALPRLGLLLFVFLMTENLPAIGSEAHDAFSNKNYGEAAELFRQREEDSNDLQVTYNRAVSEYYDKNYAGAAEGFARAAQSEDLQLANKARFNLGNALAAQGKFAEAIESYNQVLEAQPDDVKAKENLAWAKKMLEQQKQKQEQRQEGETQKREQGKEREQKQGKAQEQEEGQEQEQTQRQGQTREQEQEQAQSQGQTREQGQTQEQEGKHRHIQKHEAERLLRRLGDKIGIKPRIKAKPNKKTTQKW